MSYDRKYNAMEPILQEINRDFIQINDFEDRNNSVLLNFVVSKLITKMKEDKLFNQLYSTNYFGGSYYCGLKVGKPDEYDLDMLFRLPVYANPQIEVSDVHGFVKARILNMNLFLKNSSLSSNYPEFKKKLCDEDDYLVTDKVLKWMESVINKALNSLKSNNGTNFLIDNKEYHLFLRKQGPAFTLELKRPTGNQKPMLCIDLVPCFVFTEKNWPGLPYYKNPTSKDEFFIVPKVRITIYGEKEIQHWRLSFQIQENELMKGSRYFKPSLKLIKKLRDEFDHTNISSYYIKTIFLRTLTQSDVDIWNNSLSYAFMEMLKIYQKYIEREQIEYFWNCNFNLIGNVPSYHLQQISNTLKEIIRDVDAHLDDPTRIIKYFNRSTRNVLESALVKDYIMVDDSMCCDIASNVTTSNNSWCVLL